MGRHSGLTGGDFENRVHDERLVCTVGKHNGVYKTNTESALIQRMLIFKGESTLF